MNTPYIICAAIYYDDNVVREHLPKNIKTGIVVSGWRHANCITQLKLMFYDNYQNDSFQDESRIIINNSQVQGFLTSEGNFVDREEAVIIAYKAGQLTTGLPKYLYSEDLY